MRSRHQQRGAAGGLIAIIALLVVVAFLAVKFLSQITQAGARSGALEARFASLQAGLLQFVVANGRLPCPANPTVDDGDAVPATATLACTYPDGTVPWRTIGARRDDAIDPWGGRISYRVYTGASGALTQDKGASMVDCDLVPSGTGTAVDAVGKCQYFASVTERDTSPATYLAGKGLQVTDMGTVRNDAAYVLLSHGPTGLGSYTTNNVRRDLPATGGDERANTNATGPFVLKAFSTAGTDPASSAHFDDYLAYRRLPDLITAAGLAARDWPETVATSTVTIDRPTVEAAVGHSVTPGQSIGQATLNLAGVTASGFGSGGVAADISYDESAGNGGAGLAGGGSAELQSAAGEKLRLDFAERATRFGVTLNAFGINAPYYEVVEFRFFLDGVETGSPRYGIGCQPDGGLAHFNVDVGGTFNRVEITPIPAFDSDNFTFTGATGLFVTQVRSCTAADATCWTPLYATDITRACTLL